VAQIAPEDDYNSFDLGADEKEGLHMKLCLYVKVPTLGQVTDDLKIGNQKRCAHFNLSIKRKA